MDKEKVKKVLDLLEEEYPEAECALHHRNVFELIVAVALSAQTTDKSVNQVTPELFEKYPDAEALSKADPADVEKFIRRIGMYKTKSKNIVAMAERIVSDFGGQVPETLEELTSLAGVGRKTANVIRGNIYHEPSIVVDTHVKRISARLGFTEETDPAKVELDLMRVLPKDHWILYNMQIITLGRQLCKALNPKCGECFLTEVCPCYQKNAARRSAAIGFCSASFCFWA